MFKIACIAGATWLLTALICGAEDYPLTFKTVPEKDVISFPGGSGGFAGVGLQKPGGLIKEPKPVSRRPLYGICSGLRFRLDESKGTEKGYDQLLVDLNGNGSLSDETAVREVAGSARTRAASMLHFGPIELPANKAVCGGRPVYYAIINLYNLDALQSGPSVGVLHAVGQLRLKAAWYLETSVEAAGAKRFVGVCDGNADLTLGTVARAETYTGPGNRDWYFRPADSFLVDSDGSGAFEAAPLNTEYAPFGPILYLGAVPYKAALSADFKTLSLTRWSSPLADIVLQPNGGEVQSLTLAWERPNAQWQLVRVGLDSGKARVPPGKYRLYACTLAANLGKEGAIMASAYERVPRAPFVFEAGQTNALKCGAPLDIKVVAEKRKPQSYEPAARETYDPKKDSEYILSIDATATGAEGEVYSSYASGAKFRDEPAKPVFAISDVSGKKLASGNLEYG